MRDASAGAPVSVQEKSGWEHDVVQFLQNHRPPPNRNLILEALGRPKPIILTPLGGDCWQFQKNHIILIGNLKFRVGAHLLKNQSPKGVRMETFHFERDLLD